MARFLFILLLPLAAFCQSGHYHINTSNGHSCEGYVTISNYSITVEKDSTKTSYPVISVTKDNQGYYYILEGCYDNQYFRGLGYFEPQTSVIKHRVYSVLYLEIRSRRKYEATRYSLYYEQ